MLRIRDYIATRQKDIKAQLLGRDYLPRDTVATREAITNLVGFGFADMRGGHHPQRSQILEVRWLEIVH